MADMTALAKIAREFSRAIERRAFGNVADLTPNEGDAAFRADLIHQLEKHTGPRFSLQRVVTGLAAAEAGFVITEKDGLQPLPLKEIVDADVASFMRAGIYANAACALGPEEAEKAAALVPMSARTAENFNAVYAVDGAFARMLKP